jgi:hypothetical protein
VGTAYREASTLAYADAFRAIMIAFVIATFLVPLMRNVVLAYCSLTASSLTRALATDVTIQRRENGSGANSRSGHIYLRPPPFRRNEPGC